MSSVFGYHDIQSIVVSLYELASSMTICIQEMDIQEMISMPKTCVRFPWTDLIIT